MPRSHASLIPAAIAATLAGAPSAIAADCNANAIDDNTELAHVHFPDSTSGLLCSGVSGFGVNAFTVELWLRQDVSNTNGIVSYSAGTDDNEILILDLNALDTAVDNTFHNTGFNAEAAGVIGGWNHLSVSWRSSDGLISVRVNGTEFQTYNESAGSVLTDGGCLYIGQEQDAVCGGLDPAQAFLGDVRQIRFWNIFRTPAQVASDYQQALTGAEAGLVSYWPLDDASGSIALDHTGPNHLSLLGSSTWIDLDANDDGVPDECRPVINLTQLTGHTSIQDALNNAADADVIEVLPGTYTENIDTLGKAVTLYARSSNPAETVIDGGANGTSVISCTSGEGPSTVVRGFTITNGSSIDGGGMECISASPTIDRCVFFDNTAADDGGALYLENSASLVSNCSFFSNSTPGTAGALFNRTSTSTIVNCVFSGNSAGDFGGAIYNTGGLPTVTNCVFVANNAAASGGAMRNTGSSPIVTNCIAWDNTGGQITNNGGAPTVSYCNVQGGIGAGSINAGGNISTDPLFLDADGPDNNPGTTDDDLRLAFGSPCIDAGDNDATGLAGINQDLDTNPRYLDDPATADTGAGTAPVIDMGPYENTPPSPCVADFDADGDTDVLDFSVFASDFGCPN